MGTLIGSFYKLADGTVVYVPAGETAPDGSTPVPGDDARRPGTTPGARTTPAPGVTPTPGVDHASRPRLRHPSDTAFPTPTPAVTLTPDTGAR